MNCTLYEETQRFALWVYIVMVGVGKDPGNPESEPIPIGVVGLTMGFLVLMSNLMLLRVRVREEDIYVSLGILFPMMWRRVRLDAIHAELVVKYNPLRNAGGWGMRMGMFESKPTTFFNARGNRGVLLEMDTRPVLIGSQNPEPLAEAIARAREQYARTHKS
ncbi:MAG: hypothetical protein KJ060_06130 [Candidatus Hydrogenedentes bacterium]|nr:hypothetical protein [Candidatus Hydrogenedentota bacterium]